MSRSRSASPQPPEPRPIPADWPHLRLAERVKAAVHSIPLHFKSETFIEGISATDIFTLNSALGATIEEQVVETLNRLRPAWDPDDEYSLYGFVRQSQRFPDVVFRSFGPDGDAQPILLGIELKGWYVLSKEAEGSFRFTVNERVCAPADLLVVVPWALKNVLSGSPRAFTPYVQPAEYAARLRNFHWQHVRRTTTDTAIDAPSGQVGFYPTKDQAIQDRPRVDSGGNFGRIFRSGIMDAFVAEILKEKLCGVPGSAWIEFFSLFRDGGPSDIAPRLFALKRRFESQARNQGGDQWAAFRRIIDAIADQVGETEA